MDQVAIAIKALVASPKLTTVWALVAAVGVHIFGLVDAELMLIAFYLVLIDTTTGMFAAAKEGENIQSRKFFRSVAKVVVYFSFFAIVGLIGRVCLNEATSSICSGLLSDGTLQTLALIWVLGIEIKSIIENLARLGFKVPSEIQDLVDKTFQMIGNIGKDK